MFVCIVPTAVLMYILGFSGNPSKKKMIFGVRNNPKFHEGDAAEKLAAITKSCRTVALIITIAVCLVSVILFFMPVTGFTMAAWVILVLAELILIAVPYGKGNTELKSLKRELGITKKGVVYADLSSTNIIHALKMPWIILPNAICLAASVFAVLTDLGVIKVFGEIPYEKYTLTIMSMSFLLIAALLIPIAYMMDNTRNTVISKDSNINANYNRAKKKCWADLMIGMSWANTLYVVATLILMMFINSEIMIIAGVLAYTLIIMVCVVIGAKTQMAVEKRYDKDTDLELQDDDDNWIFGMFYYNPNDTRLNVEKRFGYGGTVNIAHPAGKVIMIISALIIIALIGLLVWAAVTDNFDAINMNLPF